MGTDHMRTSGQMAGKAAPGINAYVALLTPVLTLAGCVGPIQLLSQPPATVESLEGDYLRLALCKYERLDRKDGRLRIAEPSDQDSMRIDFDPGSGQHWDLVIHKRRPGQTDARRSDVAADTGRIFLERACAGKSTRLRSVA